METHTILSGKYRLCQKIGHGRSSTVYLAVHQELEEYRAIKCISKESADYGQFLKEAHLLRDLRHPGIPIIYDLAEDENFSYLIEEYLSGDTLQALVSAQGPLSRAMTIQYGIQICRLVHFLHSAKSTPILYLDLQPQNLLVCSGTLKLIDFGQAVGISEAEQLTKRYGTIGYAAPEQYTAELLDERTDLYAIGAVLYFMRTGKCPEPVPSYPLQYFDSAMEQILRTCLTPSREERYASAEILENALCSLTDCAYGETKEQADLSLTIAVAGVKAGAGTTHMAIGLSVYLMECGYHNQYEEKNSSGAILRMADWFRREPDRCGCVHIRGIRLLPQYGPAACFETGKVSCVIRDYGTAWSAISLHQADAVLLICGSRWWEQSYAGEAYEALKAHPGLVLIYNHISGQKILLPSGAKKDRCFPMPFFPDPFEIQSQTLLFYTRILKSALDGRKELKLRCGEHSLGRKIRNIRSLWKQRRSQL